jgi:hypothetical protein
MTTQEVKRKLTPILSNEENKNMGCGFVRSAEKVSICLLSVFVAVFVLFCNITRGEVYDDFSSENIDTTKWTIHSWSGAYSSSTSGNTPGLFIQSKGRLHFFCKKDVGESLISTTSFEPGFFRIEFYEFYSTNDAPPGRRMGSFLALGLGSTDNYVRMLRGRVSTKGYFEANYFANNTFQLWYVPTAVAFGQLGLYYDGSMVSFFYNIGLNPDKGWQRVGPRVTPGWSSSPPFFISGYPGASGRTTFAVDNVEYLPVPLPPSFLRRLER